MGFDDTPLHYAAQSNENAAVIGALLAAGADTTADGLYAFGSYNDTPLLRAAKDNENPAVVEALVAAGADLDARGSIAGRPCMRALTYNENLAVVEALLAAGSDISAAAHNYGDTPLHVAGAPRRSRFHRNAPHGRR